MDQPSARASGHTCTDSTPRSSVVCPRMSAPVDANLQDGQWVRRASRQTRAPAPPDRRPSTAAPACPCGKRGLRTQNPVIELVGEQRGLPHPQEGREPLDQRHALVALPSPFELIAGQARAPKRVVDRLVDLLASRCTIRVLTANDACECAGRPVVHADFVVVVRREDDAFAPGRLMERATERKEAENRHPAVHVDEGLAPGMVTQRDTSAPLGVMQFIGVSFAPVARAGSGIHDPPEDGAVVQGYPGLGGETVRLEDE